MTPVFRARVKSAEICQDVVGQSEGWLHQLQLQGLLPGMVGENPGGYGHSLWDSLTQRMTEIANYMLDQTLFVTLVQVQLVYGLASGQTP